MIQSAAENLCDPNPRVTAAQNHAVLLSRRVFHKNKINDSTLPSLSIKFPVIAIGGDTLSETVCIRSQLLDKHNCLTQVYVCLISILLFNYQSILIILAFPIKTN